MNFQHDQPFFRIGARIGEFGDELVDLVDDASLCRTVRATVPAGSGRWPKPAVPRFRHRARRWRSARRGSDVMLAGPVAVGVAVSISLRSLAADGSGNRSATMLLVRV